VASKPGSQEICFVPDGDYRGFVRRRHRHSGSDGPLSSCACQPGEIVDRAGRVLGRHSGLIDYTVGQRRGLRIARARPLYVIALDAQRNRVVVGEKGDVFARGLVAGEINWVSVAGSQRPFAARVQIRYRHEAAPAMVEPLGEGRVRAVFESPQPAVTPGQAAVFYDTENERLLGGGWIEKPCD
ncbi:tRNA 2-thiouridine(34) synthase MnmA, partial [Candidatus Sumerlaeota bacterium]|nr:tRNA 2-thiouridine(34) synthase MnmA [Candidatus Sumerlaeota bacterium]